MGYGPQRFAFFSTLKSFGPDFLAMEIHFLMLGGAIPTGKESDFRPVAKVLGFHELSKSRLGYT